MWKRQEPVSIPMLEALLRRLPIEEAKFFEEKLRREKSGLYGEQRLDREWLDFQIQAPFVLLNGLRFENEAGYTHQIDRIFVFVLILFLCWKQKIFQVV
ncbi:hypothetical protein [Ureibacillus aquaedulcis]|uniref:Uncharacterized protein n=1 Tax=Ureibacillus aquaedulcis TaxID=3058421 RepID=A0ABT8GKR5_9BACL|nr:hypothetical protein [Ureibacillus sp. BA0131]MDN4492003.1 hypothetical protein [Ureibacillus sp. BA0131]